MSLLKGKSLPEDTEVDDPNLEPDSDEEEEEELPPASFEPTSTQLI